MIDIYIYIYIYIYIDRASLRAPARPRERKLSANLPLSPFLPLSSLSHSNSKSARTIDSNSPPTLLALSALPLQTQIALSTLSRERAPEQREREREREREKEKEIPTPLREKVSQIQTKQTLSARDIPHPSKQIQRESGGGTRGALSERECV